LAPRHDLTNGCSGRMDGRATDDALGAFVLPLIAEPVGHSDPGLPRGLRVVQLNFWRPGKAFPAGSSMLSFKIAPVCRDCRESCWSQPQFAGVTLGRGGVNLAAGSFRALVHVARRRRGRNRLIQRSVVSSKRALSGSLW